MALRHWENTARCLSTSFHTTFGSRGTGEARSSAVLPRPPRARAHITNGLLQSSSTAWDPILSTTTSRCFFFCPLTALGLAMLNTKGRHVPVQTSGVVAEGSRMHEMKSELPDPIARIAFGTAFC